MIGFESGELKRFAPLAAAALLMFSLAACSPKPAPTAASSVTGTPAPVPTTAAASVFKIQEGGIQFEVPAGWQAEKRDENRYAVSTPDGAALLIFVPVEDKAQAEKVVADFKQKLQNVKPSGAAKNESRNGLGVRHEGGEADADGTPQRWEVDLISAERPVVVYSQVRRSAPDARRAEAEQIVRSIRKLS